MTWIGFFIASPTRLVITVLVVAAVLAYFWPGVVAHVVWVAVCAIFVGLWWLLLELKWLLLAGGLCIAAYASFRYV